MSEAGTSQSRLHRLLSHPRRWPLRWRLAGVSAGLTLIILVVFAVVVGVLVSNRMRDDFREEVQYTASRLALQVQSSQAGLPSQSDRLLTQLQRSVMSGEAAVRVVDANGNVPPGLPAEPDLGPPQEGVVTRGSVEVASALVLSNFLGEPPLYVQYARDNASVEATIDRLWLFLAGGVLAGTALAALAGVAIGRRAMRPIAGLTATAREIASTRDPSRRVPQPETGDEVAELAGTLDAMLQSLDAARTETEQMMRTQREFVADASHELRTPLTSVLANLELLQASLAAEQAAADGEERSEMVDSALRSSRRMSRLVSDLLLLARADAGRATPRRDSDLAEIATAAATEATPLAGGRRITLEAEDRLPVIGNPDELHRMVSNLIDNAIRHTPDGATVEVRAERRDGAAVIEVSDDGPGLPAELGDQIFERFVRGSGPADRASDAGTGLGLAIVQAVASSHSGSVEAGSSAADGARFVVRLPLSEREPAPTPAPTAG